MKLFSPLANTSHHIHKLTPPCLAPTLTAQRTTEQTIGVHRDCFGCGRTCEECRTRYMRTCRFCRAEYCVIDNEGSSDTEVCESSPFPTCNWVVFVTFLTPR
jgi:hypothetical protein